MGARYLPAFASILAGRVAFAWHAMDAFYEEDERILGHAADAYHRIDIRQTSRHLVVRAGDEVVAETHRPLVLFESGFAPRWYVPREDVGEHQLTPVARQTFCPYKGLCDYYDIGAVGRAAWSYRDAYREVDRIEGHISFEPDKVTVTLDGVQLEVAPGQQVVPHGPDRGLTPEEAIARRALDDGGRLELCGGASWPNGQSVTNRAPAPLREADWSPGVQLRANRRSRSGFATDWSLACPARAGNACTGD